MSYDDFDAVGLATGSERLVVLGSVAHRYSVTIVVRDAPPVQAKA